MREGKVRGYATDEMTGNQWLTGFGVFRIGFTEDYAAEVGRDADWIIFTEFSNYPVHEESVGWYTGLKDKNGREIYEGDIVKREFEIGKAHYHPVTLGFEDYEVTDSGYFIGVVHFRPAEGWVLNKCNKYSDEGEFIRKRSGVKIHAQYAEVIGNIYENPELLEAN